MAIIFHRLAAAEFVAARRWYRRVSPALEAKFVAAIDAAAQIIESTPKLGALFLKRYRWLRTHGFPYLLYYAPSDGSSTPVVFAMAHARRRLGYWLRRTNTP
jgi:hypothetical protein